MTARHVSPLRPFGMRRGLALADAIIGGVILSIGLAAVMSLTGRAISRHAHGEKQLVASWLADELLTMVVVEGPDQYDKLYDTEGRFESPFDDFGYEVEISDPQPDQPYEVSAVVLWGERGDQQVRVDTIVALRGGDPEQPREPHEPVDRDSRYFADELTR